MNCRRVGKLIPLYVEGDLASEAADRLAAHLEWCGRCNFLADEYKESQSWLRSSEAPLFDEATLNGLKAGVLRRIAESNAKPSFLASLIQQWGRRQSLALSAAMLIIVGVVVFYIHRVSTNVKQVAIEAVKQPPDEKNQTPNEPRPAPNPETAPGAGLSGRRNRQVQAKNRMRTESAIVIKQNIAPPVLSQANTKEHPEDPAAKSSDPFTGLADDSRDMLRIEIQTSDPNIRIIWFAPKEVESP
jgi:hypothetical protein